MRKFIVALFFISLSILFIATLAVEKFERSSPTCSFCKDEQLNGQKFYEDEFVTCLIPTCSVTEGHALIVPKRHIQHFEQLSQKEIERVQIIVAFLNKQVKELYHTDDYLLLFEKIKLKSDHSYFNYIPHKPHQRIFWSLRWLDGWGYPLSGSASNLQLMTFRKIFSQWTKENSSNTPLPDGTHSPGDQTPAYDHLK